MSFRNEQYIGTNSQTVLPWQNSFAASRLFAAEMYRLFSKIKIRSTQKTITTKYPNAALLLSWDAGSTDLQWDKEGHLYALERCSGKKIELNLRRAAVHNGQLIVDMKSRDNKLLRVEAAQNDNKAVLLQFDSLDFPADKQGLAMPNDSPVRVEIYRHYPMTAGITEGTGIVTQSSLTAAIAQHEYNNPSLNSLPVSPHVLLLQQQRTPCQDRAP